MFSRGITAILLCVTLCASAHCGIGKGLGLDSSEAREDSRKSRCIYTLYILASAARRDGNNAVADQIAGLMYGCDGNTKI